MKPHRMITITGPTASGKTALAVAVAAIVDGEILSGDSRQVYRRMDIGTGKDLAEYARGGRVIPHHLINICEPGEKYNLHRYQRDFHKALHGIRNRGRIPILCGGSGLYIESILRGYNLPEAPANPELREMLKDKTLPELADILASYKPLHNITDVDTAQRAIRAIEIEEYGKDISSGEYSPVPSLIVCLHIEREQRSSRIGARLRARMEQGMIREVEQLLAEGLSPDDLLYYGLEYKFITLHLTGRLSYSDMLERLEIAIRQFSKRQVTWLKGMERRGLDIHWIDAEASVNRNADTVLNLYYKQDND